MALEWLIAHRDYPDVYVYYVDEIVEVKEKSIIVRCNLDKIYETKDLKVE